MPKDKRRKKGGILLFTVENGELVAHLQQRGRYDYNHGKPNTWPGICQVTAEGKRRPDENPLQAAVREAEEELQTKLSPMVWYALLGGMDRLPIHKDKHISIFGLLVPTEAMKTIRLERITGGLVRVKEKDIDSLIPAIPMWRIEAHPHYYRDIVVLPETILALRKGFARFKRLI